MEVICLTISETLQINESLVDSHLKLIPSLRTLSTGNFSCSDSQSLGGHLKWFFHFEILFFCAPDQTAHTFSEDFTLHLVRFVDIRNVHTCREFLWVYLSQADDNCQEAISQQIEKMLWIMAVLQFILIITIEGGASVKFIGGRLGRGKKAKWENLWDEIKRDKYFLCIGVYRIDNS